MVLIGLVLAGGVPVRADWPERIEQVRATAARDDDLGVARELLERARRPATPAVEVAERAAAAVELAGSDFPYLALAALDRQARRCPALRMAALERSVALGQVLYRRSTGLEKRLAGRLLIERTVRLVRAKARAGEKNLAEAFCRQALALGGQISPADRLAIEPLLRELPGLIERGRTLRALQQAVDRHPGDTERRVRLVRVLLLTCDDPAGAEEALSADLPPAWRSFVQLAARGPKALPAPVAASFADWLALLATAAPVEQRVALAGREMAWQEQILRRASAGPLRDRAEHRWRTLHKLLARPPAEGNWAIAPAGTVLLAPPGTGRAVSRARQFLQARREPTGLWQPGPKEPPGRLDAPAATALASLALLKSGIRADSPRLGESLDVLADLDTDRTAAVALRCCCLAATVRDVQGRYAKPLQRDVQALLNGAVEGGWAETLRPDASARPELLWTQYATFALARAERLGLDVPGTLWARLLPAYARFRPHREVDPDESASVDAHFTRIARTWGLLVASAAIGRDRNLAMRNSTIRKDLAWLGSHLDEGGYHDPPSLFFGLVRLVRALDSRRIGHVDAFEQVSESLLRNQAPDGAWRCLRRGEVISTALGLLALTDAEAGW
jgi:hypothetical protein